MNVHHRVCADWPSADEALHLPIDELALRLLRFVASGGDTRYASRQTAGSPNQWQPAVAGKERAQEAALRGLEAWDWLVHHGLVALPANAHSPGDRAYVTPRGQEAAEAFDGLRKMRAEARIGIELHERLESRIRPQFMMGEYELAAFAAMREVEIRVRELGGLEDDVVGVPLMRRAFDKLGPLADPAQVPAEQEGTSHLFAGAMALFKNPSSHRQVDIDDPTVASEIVLLADLLLRLLDRVERRINDTA